MPSSETQFLIIGQGLAGSILAYQLMEAGQSVVVFDNNHYASSSMVAAGIINPVTGHRLNITDGFFWYQPIAERFYQQLETKLKCQIYQPTKQLRLIKNAGQKEYLDQRLGQENYRDLMEPCENSPFQDKEFGAIEVGRTAVVDAPTLLADLQKYLIANNSYKNLDFDYAQLQTHDHGIRYQGLHAKHVIFCEGYQAVHNPWLQALPFKLAKGEVLTVECEGGLPEPMLSWGNWLVPNKGSMKLGSNFIWNDLSAKPSQETADKLLVSLHQATGIRAAVQSHEVGIRPTTKHRTPFIGALSTLNNAFCFNGFGSKGCLTMPYYAELLVEHLLQKTELPTEVTQWL